MTYATASARPLVSIITFCRNAAPTIRRAIDSVLSSTYDNIELIVQDGDSTDGTVEILRGFGERICLKSEPDTGPADAFHKALARCRGEIIGSCLADEELLPQAITEVVAYFATHKDVGAITGDVLITDQAGEVKQRAGAEFDLVEYLLGRRTPYFCASFLSLRALRDIGYFDEAIVHECFEFEIWTRLGTRHRVAYTPRELAKYATHKQQLSNTPAAITRHIDARMEVLDRLFSEDGFFGHNPRMRQLCVLGQYRMFYAHAVAYALKDVAAAIEPRLSAAAAASGSDAALAREWFAEQQARGIWLRFGNLFPPTLKRWILARGLHLHVRASFLALTRLLQGTRPPREQQNGVSLEKMADLALYHEVAMIFHARGQIEEALELWQRAEAMGNAEIDALACQAAQRAPSFGPAEIFAIQKHWAERYAPGSAVPPRAVRASTPPQPIRVGYHCAWWDSATARHQLLNVIREHDRAKLAPCCYSPIPVPHDIARHFDLVRVTGQLSDDGFVDQARADRLDVLVETTGFSPHHRYAAMARRCAPVQISYLNHHATTATPNVDYVLGDELLRNGPDRPFFTEEIYPLRGCFFCFDLRDENIAYAREAPCLRNGYTTFGCFGGGGKLNLWLIELWAEILRGAPTARLVLRNRDLTPADNRRYIERCFGRFGISPDRLHLMGGTDHTSILRNYADIDISLDTSPYCGGNTIAESFWQGVPVITLLGTRLSARYGASLVRAHGCPELVAESRERYVAIAAELAGNHDRIGRYRRELRQSTTRSGFNDSTAFARKLEDAYADMLSRLS